MHVMTTAPALKAGDILWFDEQWLLIGARRYVRALDSIQLDLSLLEPPFLPYARINFRHQDWARKLATIRDDEMIDI